MTLKIFIRDGSGSGHLAAVTHANELIVVGSTEDNKSKFQSLNVANTAFNFFTPKPGFNFMITSVLTSTPGGGATVDIYEATSSTSTTISKQILRLNLIEETFIPINFSFGGFLPITEGFYLNAKTNTATANITIIGFYRKIHVH